MARTLASLLVLLGGCPGPDTASLETDPQPIECPDYDPTDTFQVLLPELAEASGLVAGVSGEVLWSHNDSGDLPRVFAISSTGQPLGEVRLSGVSAVDWEDMARITIDGVSYLVLADLGDNLARRTDAQLVLFEEPAPPGTAQVATAQPFRVVPVSYSTGPVDVEAITVDPLDGSLIVLSKQADGSTLFTAGDTWWDEPELVLQPQGFLPLGSDTLPGSPNATAMDVSSDGALVVVRTYSGAWVFRRPQGPLIDAFDTEPCEAPAALEQGEAIAFLGVDYFTLPEALNPELVRYSADTQR